MRRISNGGDTFNRELEKTIVLILELIYSASSRNQIGWWARGYCAVSMLGSQVTNCGQMAIIPSSVSWMMTKGITPR